MRTETSEYKTLPKLRRKRSRKKQRRGFAAMSPEVALALQRAGGISTSMDKAHMARIGRRGGKAKSAPKISSTSNPDL